MDSVSTLLNTKPMRRKEWRSVLAHDPCAYCGLPADENDHPEIDHIIAYVGTANDRDDNLTGACRRCNRRKKSRSLLSVLSGHPELGPNRENKVYGIHYGPGTRKRREAIRAANTTDELRALGVNIPAWFKAA